MKKIKLVLFKVFFLIFSLKSVFAQPQKESNYYELEKLWLKCEENAESIFAAEQNLDYYLTVKNTSRVLYPLSFTVNTTPDFYKNYEQYSDELEMGNTSLGLVQTLPGGAKLSASASYSVYSGYRNWNSTDGYTDKGYSDSFSAQVQYSQSLNPYWLHGTFKDPAKRKTSFNAEISECNLMQAKKNSYSKVLSLYIQFRKNSRNLALAEKQLCLLKLNLDSIRSMHSSNSAFKSDVWQAEKSFGEAESALNSAVLEKEEILESLRELCGDDFEIYPALDVDAGSCLPESPERLFETDPFLNTLQIQLQILKGQFLLDMQNCAAVVSFSGNFKDSTKIKDNMGLSFKDDKNYLHWSATFSGKINNLYGGESKLYRKKYETECAKYEKQIQDYMKKTDAEKTYYDNLILSFEEKIRSASLNEANEKEKFGGIKKLYENGQKRQIDVLSAEINYLSQKYALQNLKDALWQTKWHRVQFSD